MKSGQNRREITVREEKLRVRLERLNVDVRDDEEKLRAKNERKFARLERKIERTRARTDAKILRREQSKVAKKSPILYAILTPIFALGRWSKNIVDKILRHDRELHLRRPHRSFALTPRAKTKRGIAGLGGYFAFCGEVFRVILKNKWLFGKFLALYVVFALIIVGLMDQGNFATLRKSLDGMHNGAVSNFIALFSGAVTGISTGSGLGAQQPILSILLLLFGWLAIVYLLRELMRGDKPKLRDGLYGGGSAVLATAVLVLVVFVQLIPFAIMLMIYNSLSAVGIINSGVAIENMAAWCALALACLLSLYWICSTFVALVIVTLPGTYPLVALRLANELVVSRRLLILFRLLAMAAVAAVIWLAILSPAIWLDGVFASLKWSWIPLVPVVVMILSTLTVMWCATYIYVLYRKLVDDPTPPLAGDWKTIRDQKREQRRIYVAAHNRVINARRVGQNPAPEDLEIVENHRAEKFARQREIRESVRKVLRAPRKKSARKSAKIQAESSARKAKIPAKNTETPSKKSGKSAQKSQKSKIRNAKNPAEKIGNRKNQNPPR